VHDLFAAVQTDNRALASALISPKAEFMATYREEEAGKAVQLTYARLRALSQRWAVAETYRCQDDLAVVTWKRGKNVRYSRVWTKDGFVVKIVGDTAPLVCTTTRQVNG
jgi:hypothetical protein